MRHQQHTSALIRAHPVGGCLGEGKELCCSSGKKQAPCSPAVLLLLESSFPAWKRGGGADYAGVQGGECLKGVLKTIGFGITLTCSSNPALLFAGFLNLSKYQIPLIKWRQQ